MTCNFLKQLMKSLFLVTQCQLNVHSCICPQNIWESNWLKPIQCAQPNNMIHHSVEKSSMINTTCGTSPKNTRKRLRGKLCQTFKSSNVIRYFLKKISLSLTSDVSSCICPHRVRNLLWLPLFQAQLQNMGPHLLKEVLVKNPTLSKSPQRNRQFLWRKSRQRDPRDMICHFVEQPWVLHLKGSVCPQYIGYCLRLECFQVTQDNMLSHFLK